uniref:ATP synthase subunit a n=1 Tax=Aradacanthia heissi TaxID=928818 RepID=I6LNM8_9HEMI|nr:ATP synthase F0 subunit 6 [Aradacanthia heissi]
MMTNLFSSFDPATSNNMSMNWTSMLIMFSVMPYLYWKIPNQLNVMIMKITNLMNNEFKLLINDKHNKYSMMFTSLFIMILINNMMGLLPYVFTCTSHMMINLTLALPLWLSFMVYGWINQTENMLAHLIPQGTPAALMPFMVCIEMISNIIRPGSLAVRLTANMIAGHLLITLLGNNTIESNMTIMIMIIMSMLVMFEVAVSIIQAYVFSVLSSLYSSEVK